MALTRILGSAVRHPLATAALGVGLAKGGVEVARRLVRPAAHDSPPAPDPAPSADVAPPEPEVVLAPVPETDELAEPVVLYAADPDPEPAPDLDPQAEDELVWTSESSGPPPASQ